MTTPSFDSTLRRRSFLSTAGLFGLAVAGGSGVLSSCSAGDSSSEAAGNSSGGGTIAPGGTLIAALTGEPDSLDPAISSIYTGAQVYGGIFSKLIDIDPAGEFVGQLATSWEQPDDVTWVFDLMDGVTFHNGEAFTAEDVKYTFERILDPATASAYAPLYAAVDSIEATTPTQVTFRLSSPYGPFLTNLANNGQIVNQVAVEGADPARNPVGTGPFEFVEWVQGDHLTLKRHDAYFKPDRPFVDGVEFRFLLVDQSRIDALAAGEINWSDAVPLQQLPTLSTDARFTYVTNAVAGIPDFLSLNTTKAPFDNLELRQAVAWALDRTAIRDIAYFGAGEIGVQEVPSGSSWFDGSDTYEAAPDPTKVRALLAKAGFAQGLTIHYLGLPQYPELLKTGEVVRDQLKEFGIDMQIEQVDVAVWFDRFVSGDYEITSAYQERTVDPDNFYSLVVRSGGSINTSGYSNPEVDNLIDEAASLTDEAARKEIYSQIREIVRDEAPIIFVHYETINYLMAKTVSGSTVRPTLDLVLEDVGFTA